MINEITSTFSPDAHSVDGADGKPYYEYSVSYGCKEGKRWTFSIWATDDWDARNRLDRIQSQKLEANQIYQSIPAKKMGKLRVMWSCFWRNLLA